MAQFLDVLRFTEAQCVDVAELMVAQLQVGLDQDEDNAQRHVHSEVEECNALWDLCAKNVVDK